jgi:hypothetical protein
MHVQCEQKTNQNKKTISNCGDIRKELRKEVLPSSTSFVECVMGYASKKAQGLDAYNPKQNVKLPIGWE